MKKMVFLFALAVLLKPLFPVVEYVVNYQYITQELCENKDNVVMGCDGKCYLIKQLAKSSESDKPLSQDKKHAAAEHTDLFFETIPETIPLVFAASPAVTAFPYQNLYAHLSGSGTFHPPAQTA